MPRDKEALTRDRLLATSQAVRFGRLGVVRLELAILREVLGRGRWRSLTTSQNRPIRCGFA